MIGKRTILVGAASLAVLVGAGAAAASYGAPGPPSKAPRLGLHAGAHQAFAYGRGNGVMAGGVVIDAAAKYLGLSETALATARHDGKSLAQIATERGKSVAGLQQAVVAAFKANLAQAVAAGRLTQAQAVQVQARFEAQVQTMLQRTATGPPDGRGAGMGMGLGLGPCGGVR